MKLVGSLQWNYALGGLALIITFFSSIGNNVLLTALWRSLFAFVFFFVITYL